MLEGLPLELEKQYRRFLSGRGGVVGPLIVYLVGDRSGQAGIGAWAALVLSRIFLLKGRMGLASSYLSLSYSIFRSVGRGRRCLDIWLLRARIHIERGFIKRAELLMRAVFRRALRENRLLTAAEAALDLAWIFADSGRIDDSVSYLTFAEKHSGNGGCPGASVGASQVRAVLEAMLGNREAAVERLLTCLKECVSRDLAGERVQCLLLLAELFIAGGDYNRAEEILASIAEHGAVLQRFRRLGAAYDSMHERIGVRDGCGPLRRAGLLDHAGLPRPAGSPGYVEPLHPAAPGGPDRFLSPSRSLLSSGLLHPAAPGGSADLGVERDPYHRTAGMIGEQAQPAYCAPAPVRQVSDWTGGVFVTRDPGVRCLLEEMKRSAPLDLPVLLLGESGTGKGVLSRLIHEWSGREERPFLSVNAAALPGDLFESTLFGHARGAFTGAVVRYPGLIESAGTGTLFLDEISELEPRAQAKLLHLLDTGEYLPLGQTSVKRSRARIVAATNRKLDEEVKGGNFREDLYYRLNVLSYTVPPLRQRPADIGLLADHFLRKACTSFSIGPLAFSRSVMDLFEEYSWPGNVRELQNTVYRAGVKVRRGTLRTLHFSIPISCLVKCFKNPGSRSLPGRIMEFEKKEILEALQLFGGNRSRAAAHLGIKRTTLIYRIRRLGIE